jgi:hypothetical protein
MLVLVDMLAGCGRGMLSRTDSVCSGPLEANRGIVVFAIHSEQSHVRLTLVDTVFTHTTSSSTHGMHTH